MPRENEDYYQVLSHLFSEGNKPNDYRPILPPFPVYSDVKRLLIKSKWIILLKHGLVECLSPAQPEETVLKS